MADLTGDIIGRVNRLALRPSEKNALLPLMEGISNSVHSVTDKFGNETQAKGRIRIRILRDDSESTEELGKVIGFEIEDNGLGFTDKNFKSFCTPDSRLKEGRGGKGVGRLGWLKIFSEVRVDSCYFENEKINRRTFEFRLTERDQVHELDEGQNCSEARTTIAFKNFKPEYENRCPIKLGVIEDRIAAHFIPLFIAGNSPQIVVIDKEITDIQNLFSEHIVDQSTENIKIQLDEEFELKVWSLKCTKRMRFDPPAYHFSFIAGDSRSVIEYSIDDQLGLRLIDGEYIYIACASSPFLDKKVNSERTAFTLEGEEITKIKRAIADCARKFLEDQINELITKKVEVARAVISENPQFIYIEPKIREFAEALQPNTLAKEEIYLELSRNRFRRQKKFVAVEQEIEKTDLISDQIKTKIDEYTSYIADEKKGALATYVAKRKSVLDLFEKLLEYKDADKGTYNREDAIHQLFCPMRITSESLEIDDHNLWLLDDRLAFFNYFASDKKLSEFTQSRSDERPDIAFFYNSCVAWRDQEHSDTVILVEFKKPMREDYSSGKDPVQQVLTYVKRLKERSGVVDVRGRGITGINASTAFHCYVVADITPPLEDRLIGRFFRTPDGEGYFGYTHEPSAFVEIIPFSKCLKDARLRNAIFFQKLGITNTG